jgi:hypothetical protein
VNDGQLGADERAARAEAALDEALAERNRLWEQVQEQGAAGDEAAYWRERAESIERSRWWRAGAPLRIAKRVLADPAAALSDAAGHLRERRRG